MFRADGSSWKLNLRNNKNDINVSCPVIGRFQSSSVSSQSRTPEDRFNQTNKVETPVRIDQGFLMS